MDSGAVLALSGGVGGAKLCLGLDRLLPPGDLQVLVNTGDDFEHLGLHISPDLDTVMYTLAGLATGTYELGLAEIWQALWDREGPQHLVVTELRLPRVLLHHLAEQLVIVLVPGPHQHKLHAQVQDMV